MKPFASGLGLVLAAALVWAQTQPSFEVVSIKRSAPDERGGQSILPGGRFTTTATTLKFLLMGAYNVKSFQISGLNGWMESERYDVIGKAPDGMMRGPVGHAAEWQGANGAHSNWTEMDPNSESAKQFHAMMQTMLADRFALKVHRETKELPVYALVEAKGGSKLQPTKSANLQMKWAMGQITFQAATLDYLVNTLSQLSGRPVVDRTGLTGKYDYTLQWTPDEGQMGMFRAAGDWENRGNGDSGPSVFTALQEQLGLKLDATKAPVELLVIDHVERPSEN
jgi:uncharacterized protein (TIGR03435 family)